MSNEYPRLEPFSDSYVSPKPNDVNIELYLLRQLFNPLRFARTLIQLGYEPLPPVCSLSILSGGKSNVLYYPNIFAYSGHLFKTGGYFYVLSLGFGARFLYDMITEAFQLMNNRLLFEGVGLSIDFPDAEDSEATISFNECSSGGGDEVILTSTKSSKLSLSLAENVLEECSSGNFVWYTCQLVALKIYEVLLTQPFYVVMVRQMASFVGREPGYAWFHQAVSTIFNESGFSGFFQGLLPRVICEVLRLIFYFSACRFMRRLVPIFSDRNNMFLLAFRGLIYFIVTRLTYSYEVVTCLMAVRGSNLLAAREANSFSSWRQCKQVLTLTGQIDRGASPIFRSHVQPQHIALLASFN